MRRYPIPFQAIFGKNRLNKPVQSPSQNTRWTSTIAVDKEVLPDSSALANAKPFEEIPTYFMLPWVGTAWIYLPIIGLYNIQDQVKAVFDKRRRFGDIVREKIGSVDLVTSFNPDDMEVLYKHEGSYPYRGEFSSLKAYRESRKEWYSAKGLLILQGEEWANLRTKTRKHLMKPRVIQGYLNPLQEVARDFITKILGMRDINREVPDFLKELYKWALESIALVGLDTRLGCFNENLSPDSDGTKMIHCVQTQFECMVKLEPFVGNIPFWRLFPTPTWKKFAKASDIFTEIAFRHINRSLEELKKNTENDEKEMTLLQSMLMTEGLDLSGAMVMVADMLTAGIDTTSHSIGFFLYNMARNPEKQEHLYNEITKLLPTKEDRTTTEIFYRMRYLKACIKESQRLCPIFGGISRKMDHDIVFSGYRIPAGTAIGISLQAAYTDEKYFKNPKEFLPERWLNRDQTFNPFSFVPFGIGVRSCIGRRLAELEIIILATEIIRNFKVTYHHEDIGMFSRIINTPDKPLRFNFIER